MPPRTIDDKSLLRCTLRKSADVFAKLVLYASYAVCGVTALVLAVYGMFALCSALAEPVRVIIDAVWNWELPSLIFTAVVGVLAAIPWYAYVGIAAVAAIPVYSLLWCINREITDEDRNHPDDTYKEALVFVGVVVGVAVGLFGGYSVLWFAGSFVGAVIGFIMGGSIGLAIGQNIDTYLHYRKRMKEGGK